MTRKDYTLIATAISKAFAYDAPHPESEDAVRATANRIADALQWDNPNFDEDRFLDACGVDE